MFPYTFNNYYLQAMEHVESFSIYNASAGAGKTFTLVKNYLVILFKSPNEFKYRRILAITFTNKAVAEMKLRIVENLRLFASDRVFTHPDSMLLVLEAETGLSREAIHKKAKRLLKHIIQDFASFDVVTIDTFTHRIIRTFAHDLKIPQNFEVELNTHEVMEQAVDRLIDKAGLDEQITSILVDYALEKTDRDRSWDISRDFYQVSKLLLNENDFDYLSLLQDKNLEEFAQLKKFLRGKLAELNLGIKKSAKNLLDYITTSGLEEAHFKGKYLPGNLRKIHKGNFSINFNAAWVQNLGEEPLYAKSQKEVVKKQLDAIAPEITSQFRALQQKILDYNFKDELYKKITQLSVLQAINQEVQKIKAENNLVLISDFNKIINKNIANEPVPFIYERLGERYENYFIDEFQDTSRMQWQNLIPLIDNAISKESSTGVLNSLMLVGDAKQAIYRWRGGDADQFIDLCREGNPFHTERKKVYNLPRNFRSYSQIIDFNNAFFSQLADFFDHAEYRDIYLEGNAQQLNTQKGGLVSISFIEGTDKDAYETESLEQVVQSIQARVKNGFDLSEICILVRKNTQGIAVAQKLQEEAIPVISNESLLLKQSDEVQFIINLLQYSLREDSKAIAIKLLEYLINPETSDPHKLFQKYLSFEGQEFFDEVLQGKSRFELHTCRTLPFYEAVEYIIRAFKLQDSGGIFIQFFLDSIYDYALKNAGGIPDFLTWWEHKKERLSISTPAGSKAVQVMTIHKAKGLEFPVVIYPFAHSDLYPHNADNHNWYLPDKDEFLGFEALLMGQKAEMEQYNDQTAALYHTRRSEQQLDNINLLYVALTRSVEQLHIISKKNKKPIPPSNFADLLYQYVQSRPEFDSVNQVFQIGQEQRISNATNHDFPVVPLKLICSAKENHNLIMITQGKELWNTERSAAKSYGTRIHQLMSEIHYASDVEPRLQKALTRGLIQTEDLDPIKVQFEKLISAVQAMGFFDTRNRILNERDIYVKDQVIRPDRVEMNSNKVLLLDYKTGSPRASHQDQLSFYAQSLEEMGYAIVKKVIAYIDSGTYLEID